MPTGDVEIIVDSFEILNESKTPPFTIEDNTDGGDELRMKYRYLDLRRNPGETQYGTAPPHGH
jgi:aspartyl-tRNA synthetase